MIFNRLPPKVLGIDITSTGIKVLKLSKVDKQYQLDLLGYEPLPAGVVHEHEIHNVEVVGQALKHLCTRLNLQKNQAAVAVSGAAVITKTIEISADLSEHEQALHIESVADQYIPFPIHEVSLDYHVIGPAAQQSNKLEILLVVARLPLIEKYKSVLELAGLSAAYVDVDTYALERAYHTLIDPEYADQVVAVIDIGNLFTTLNVLSKGNTLYTRQQLFGGKQLTEEIQTHYGITFEEAEQKKCANSLPNDYEEEILKPFMQTVLQQITRAFQFYSSSREYREIQHVLLAGGSSVLPGILPLVEKELKLPTSIIDPFAKIKIGPQVNVSLLKQHLPALTVACGLALRSFTR